MVEDKGLLRAGVLDARAAKTPAQRAHAERALAAAAGQRWLDVATVAAYAAVEAEPPTALLLAALAERGVTVLLPVVAGDSLRWGRFTGWNELRPARFGLLEPVAADVAPQAAADADVVLVPALAVDRAGHRLGRGGGFYDRWLPAVTPARRVAVVYDEEVVDHVPHEPHDCPVTAALTPSGHVVLTG